MRVNFCNTKEQKRQMLSIVAQVTGEQSVYLGPPHFTYKIGPYMVDKTGTLITDYASDEQTEIILKELEKVGIIGERDEKAESQSLCIGYPRSKMSKEGIERLEHTLKAKGSLIKKALGIKSVEIIVNDEQIGFPWFEGMSSSEHMKVYEGFICALCKYAEKANRASAEEKEVENEKYTFRCFLLRLGYKGDDTRFARKVLLQNLTGDGSFKGGRKSEKTTEVEDAQ